jgi:hypothetical protein
MKDWQSKSASATARIAGLLHNAAYLRDLPISAKTMSAAIEIGKFYQANARIAFGIMGDTEEIWIAKKLLESVRRKGMTTFIAKQILKATYFPDEMRTAKGIAPGLTVLVDRGYIRTNDSTHYVVNPKVFG